MRAASIVLLSVWVAALLQAQAPAPAAQNPAPATPPAQAPPPPQGGGRQGSPASQRPPQTVTQQTYSPEQIRAGEVLFVSQCGFCHGRDAMGGETGPDLTRSIVVAEDVKGDKIGPVVRTGRLEKGMPANNLSDTDLGNVVAFIHDQKRKADTLEGNRRTVDVADLQTGNAQAGEQYFNGAGGCAKCHTPTGDFAGLATRLQGLQLMQRMFYPSGRGREACGRSASVVVRAVGDRHAAKRPRRHRPAGLSRRVHDRAHRRERLVPILADDAGEVCG